MLQPPWSPPWGGDKREHTYAIIPTPQIHLFVVVPSNLMMCALGVETL